MFVVLLGLAQHAQCADTKAIKPPLSAAEYARCQVQLTEFNQGVRTYNAEIDALKALAAEIVALSAVIDKEKAAVDRTDSAAMEALNAQIGKSNELVARHEGMKASIKAMASESAQRAAQFSEACDNRAPASSPSPKVQPTDPICSAATGAKDVERQLKAALAEIQADQKRREADVDRIAQARAKAQSWSNEKRGKIWLDILMSATFMAFEREKQPYVQDLMRIIGSKPKNDQEECLLLRRLAVMLPAIKAVNARQYGFMANEIRAAK